MSLVLTVVHAELADVVEKILNLGELLVALGSGNDIRDLQFAAKLEPLGDGLEIDVGKMLAEDTSNSRADKFASNRFRTFQLAFVFQFQLAGNGRKCGIQIGDPGDAKVSPMRAARCSALLTRFSSVVMGSRWLTPERLSTRLSSRA